MTAGVKQLPMARTEDVELARVDDAYRYRVAPDQSVSEAVVAAVATATGRRPFHSTGTDDAEPLDPLYDVLDPDALDVLFRPGGERGRVSFTYCGREVSVEGRDAVTVGVE